MLTGQGVYLVESLFQDIGLDGWFNERLAGCSGVPCIFGW